MSLNLAITGLAVVDPSRGFLPEQHVDPSRLRRLDPLSALAVAAARLAVLDAGLSGESAGVVATTGVAFGTALGCQATELRYAERLVERGTHATNPIDFPDSIDGAPAAHVAIELGLGGPSVTHADGALAGELALVHAALAIANGRALRMVVGAGEFPAPRLASVATHCAAGAARAGVVALVLEAAAAVGDRGGRVRARLQGIGFGAGHVGRGPRSRNDGTVREAIAAALRQAGGEPREAAGGTTNAALAGASGLAGLVGEGLSRVAAGDVRVVIHHATAPGGQSVALAMTS